MTRTKSAFGTTISINGVPVGKVTNIGGPNVSRNFIDGTTHDSPEAWLEFVKGLKDGGEVSIEGSYINDAGQAALVSDLDNDDLSEFQVTFPTTPVITWTFDGGVSAFSTSAPHDGKLGFSVTLKVSGKPTLSAEQSNNLSALVLTTATLIPSFSGNTYAYVATTADSSITVTPTAAAGTITVNGEIVPSGQPSSAINLGAAGTVTRVTAKVQESGKAPKTYVIDVARTA